MNKQSLDTLPSLNLSAFCELTPCQQRACASPTNLSICFARLFYLLACESYCSCVLPSCGVLELGIFKEIFALFAGWTQTHTKQSSPLPAWASNATSADRSLFPAFPLCKPRTNFMTGKSGGFSFLPLNRQLSFLHSCLVSVTAFAAFNYHGLYHGTESPELKSSSSSYASHCTNTQPGKGCSKNIHSRARGEGDTGIRSHHIQGRASERILLQVWPVATCWWTFPSLGHTESWDGLVWKGP